MIRTTVGHLFFASLEPLSHRRNVANLSFFYWYYFVGCSSELAQLVPRPYYRGRSSRYSGRLHEFSVTIPRCYKDRVFWEILMSIKLFWFINRKGCDCIPWKTTSETIVTDLIISLLIIDIVISFLSKSFLRILMKLFFSVMSVVILCFICFWTCICY